MERARDGLERVGGVGELVRVGDARAVRGGQEQAVVRADEDAAVGVAQGERPPVAAHARVDDGEMDADRHVRQRVGEDERTLQHRLGRDPVGDVDDLRVRGDPLDDAVAGADEVVLEPEVGEERDEHRSPESTSPPLTEAALRATAAASPALECSAASATTSSPAARAAREVSGPIETTAKPVPTAASARAAEAEASTKRSAAGSSCGRSSRVR